MLVKKRLNVQQKRFIYKNEVGGKDKKICFSSRCCFSAIFTGWEVGVENRGKLTDLVRFRNASRFSLLLFLFPSGFAAAMG